MEWNVNTYKQISQQVLKFGKCIDHLASLHELDDLHRLTMPKKAENIYEAFKGIQAQSNIILVYCVAVSMLDLIQDLLTDCADGVFESHADIYHSATELTATLTSLIETLAPKVLAPAFSLHTKYIKEIDEKKSELHDAEHKLNEGIQRLQLVEQELMAKSENQNQIHTSNINDLFNAHAVESKSRIQKAEDIVKEAAKQTNATKADIEKIIELQKDSLKTFAQETRNDITDSIDNASSNGMMEIQKAQSGALSTIDEKANQNIGTINKRINKEVQAFETKRKDMDELLEKVGLAKDADVTISQANAEEETANKLRNRGLIAMYGSILVLVLLFSEYLGLTFWNETPPKSLSDLTLEAFTIRFMTVLLLSSPAVYMLKESAVHRAKENLYRQRGTQLLTIRGYLSDLPDKERTEVKQDLAKNFFSFHDGKADTQNVPDFLRDMKEAAGIAKSFNGQTKTVSQRFGRKK